MLLPFCFVKQKLLPGIQLGNLAALVGAKFPTAVRNLLLAIGVSAASSTAVRILCVHLNLRRWLRGL